jgi:hypothetical protein
MRTPIVAILVGVLSLVGCRTSQRVLPRLPDPGQPLSPFVQEAHTWICAPSLRGGCTQQVFQWTVPNVAQGDSLKIVFWWYPGRTLTPTQVPLVTDSANSVYALVQEQANYSSQQQYAYIFNTPQVNSNGGNVTITVVLPFPCPNAVDLDALEYQAGFNTDGEASDSNNQFLSPQAGPLTVSSSNDVVVSAFFGNMTHVSPCSACTVRYQSVFTNFVIQEYLPPSKTPYTANFPDTPNSVGSWTVVAASFQ